MKRIALVFALCATIFPLMAQPRTQKVEGQRRYDLIVNQANDTLTFNRSLRALRANRSILTDLATGYLSMGTSTLLSASQNLVGAGISFVKEAARDKRPDWEKATMGECRFVKRLPMVTEILDFYGSPSSIGALDPTDMKFSGFGCRQYITIADSTGQTRDEEVFYLSCSLRDDEQGIARMLNHSKFEIQVDELRFNPYLCNLPNDSLSVDPSTRIGFSFDKRKDLEFKVVATIKSSWINEAIQVVNDATLGQFTITARIDPRYVGEDNVFRFNRPEDAGTGKAVSVSGASFLVPRSYVGSADMALPGATWGTGQYTVEMEISESCRINDAYYSMTDSKGKRKWRKDRWQPEWKQMKKRPSRTPMAKSLTDALFPSFAGDKWITTITEPLTTVLLRTEGQYVNAAAAGFATKIGVAPAAPAAGASAAAGTKPQQQTRP